MVTIPTIRGIIFIPRPFTPAWKVEIIKNETTYTFTEEEEIIFIEFDLPVTESVGKFELRLDNNAETYAGIFDGGETVRIYIDLDDGSTKQFEGILENARNEFDDEWGNILHITGTHVSSELVDKTVTASFDEEEISDVTNDDGILQQLINDFAPAGFTKTNITDCTTTATINWSHKPFWECIKDLCYIADYDCYIDNDKDFHFFEKSSIDCSADAVVFDQNMISIEGLGEDIADVKNKIIVYGEDDEGLPIIFTASDSTSQTDYNVKEWIIKDSNITTMAAAQGRAEAELVRLKDPELKGRVTAEGLVYVNSGETIWISDPPQAIHDRYRVLNITHRIDEDCNFTTRLEVARITMGIPHYFRKQAAKDLELAKIENPNLLQYSYNFTFDDDTNCNHTDTETSEGRLKLVSGETSGTMTSDAKTADVNITEAELRYNGTDLGISTFEISVNNGVNYRTVTRNTLYIVIDEGKKLKVKVSLASDSENPNPSVESLAILFT